MNKNQREKNPEEKNPQYITIYNIQEMLNMHYHHAFYWKIYIFWHNIHSKSKISFKNTWVVRILRFGFGQDDMDCIQLHIIWTILDSISLLYTWLNAWIRNYLWQLYDSNKTNHSDLLTLHWKWKIHVFITLLISQFACDLESFFNLFRLFEHRKMK